MNLMIPPLGTELKLIEPWTFTFWAEHRNFDALVYFDILKEDENKWKYWQVSTSFQHTLPADSILKVDRIFIRRGSKDFDSVTFFFKGAPNSGYPKKRVRFWAKLADVNRMNVEFIGVEKNG